MYAVAEPWSRQAISAPRDDRWLGQELDRIWNDFFRDIPRLNEVQVAFARPWVNRLGSISMSVDERTSYIGINSFLRFPEVPNFVTIVTIAHELAHYAHGFGSPLPRRHRHPHRGGIIQRELDARGLADHRHAHQDWIRRHWDELFASKGVLRTLAR